jgi:hypothetical protein
MGWICEGDDYQRKKQMRNFGGEAFWKIAA